MLVMHSHSRVLLEMMRDFCGASSGTILAEKRGEWGQKCLKKDLKQMKKKVKHANGLGNAT